MIPNWSLSNDKSLPGHMVAKPKTIFPIYACYQMWSSIWAVVRERCSEPSGSAESKQEFMTVCDLTNPPFGVYILETYLHRPMMSVLTKNYR